MKRNATRASLATLSLGEFLPNRGQAVGMVENATQDLSCIAPRVFDSEAVIWNTNAGTIGAFEGPLKKG